jgi:hypothetical protein
MRQTEPAKETPADFLPRDTVRGEATSMTEDELFDLEGGFYNNSKGDVQEQ